MPEQLSRLDYFDIARRFVKSRSKRINPKEIDTAGSDINIILGACSFMASAVARQNIEQLGALLWDSAEDEQLDRLAYDRWGEEGLRKGASAAVVPGVISRPTADKGAGSIDIGTKVLSLKGIEYITITTGTLGVNELSCPVNLRAVQAGKEYQVGANQLRRFDKPTLLFDPTLVINNPEPAAGGEPAETNDVFRDRMRGYFNTQRRGTTPAIENGAKQVPGVYSAQAIELLNGDIPDRFVELFFADSSGIGNAALAQAVRLKLSDYKAAGIYVRHNTSTPAIESIIYKLTFRAGVNGLALRDEIRNASVGFVNSLGVNEPLRRADLNTLLSRYKQSGLIVSDDTIVSPVGDKIPDQGTTIRTRPENITFI